MQINMSFSGSELRVKTALDGLDAETGVIMTPPFELMFSKASVPEECAGRYKYVHYDFAQSEAVYAKA